jgi:hypothetical protein
MDSVVEMGLQWLSEPEKQPLLDSLKKQREKLMTSQRTKPLDKA